MQDKLYDASQFVFSLVEKAMANSITFSGEENLDKNFPTLFVANHFTRIETFLIPYVLYKKLNFKVRSLADHSIFMGVLGDYLNAVGTVSTKDELRNEKILGDLITGRVDWVIYPEGAMIKSKKVLLSENTFQVEDKNGIHDIYTGSAVLALKSEVLKAEFMNAKNACDIKTIREFKEKYFFQKDEKISYHNTRIIPLTMSYSPIRKGENNLSNFFHKYVNTKANSITEEIDIESNLLLDSQLHIHFSPAIDAKDYFLQTKKELQNNNLDYDDNAVIEKARTPLTNIMMNEVYKNIFITFDHVFALCLEYYDDVVFTLDELKMRIFLISRELQTLQTYHLGKILSANLYKLLNDEKCTYFDEALELALEQKILQTVDDFRYRVDIANFHNEHTFHTIRLLNIFRVLINETVILHELHNVIRSQVSKTSAQIKNDVFFILYRRDLKQFKYDYNKFYSVFDSKDKDIGKPFILYNEDNEVGCIISHGYKSAPKEIEPLANFLFENGINVYGIRLKGHGTMPEDLRDATHEDWYDSFDIGYSALRVVSKKLFVCGFSTGGLIALLKATNVKRVDGIICINSAVSLQDIRVKYVVPTINVLNNLLSVFNADIDTYESEPEHPEINYKMHYLTSVGELKKLVDIVNDKLHLIDQPTLIIQSDKDPIVNPKSADIIYETISSEIKEKYIVKSNKHVITLDEGVNEDVFKRVVKFIKKLS